MASTPIIDEHELEIHTSLYENVFLLSIAYDNPTLIDGTHLQDHLRPDMFIKPNKFLFEQIIYNLLIIINPDSKKKIIWPLYEKKMESQFRNDIKEIVNTLNDNYPEARIPVVQTSHLIFPGNSKCIRLLWYLSELAILQYLRRLEKDDVANGDSNCLQLPFRISSTDDDLERLQLKLHNINCFVNSEYQNLIDMYTKSKGDVIQIRDEAMGIVSAINELQQNEGLQEMLPENVVNTDVSVLKVNTADFQHSLTQLQHITQTIESLMCFLSKFTQNSEISTLKFSVADEQLNNLLANYSNIFNQTNQLKLIKFFEVIDNIFKQYVINFELFTSVFDSNLLETKYSTILSDYINLVNELIKVCKPKLLQMNSNFQKTIAKYNQKLLNTTKKDSSNVGDKIELDHTSELNFNVSFSNQKILTDRSCTTAIKRQTILETLTTLKKQQRPIDKVSNLSEKKSNARRNLIPLKNTIKGGISPVLAGLSSANEPSKSSSADYTKEILTPNQINEDTSLPTPSGNSTPITSGGTLTNVSPTLPTRRIRKSRTSEIHQLLSQNISTPQTSLLKLDNAQQARESPFNISNEIINLLLVDDNLDSSNLIFNISKN